MMRQLPLMHFVQNKPPVVPWLVEGLVARGCLTLLAGEPGQGKSHLAMDIARGVSTGGYAMGMWCTPSSTLYIDAENGPHEIHRRIHRFGITDGISLYDAQGHDLKTKGFDELKSLIVEHQPGMIVLDGLRKLWSGDENDSGHVTLFLAELRELLQAYEVGCLLLHHANKGSGLYRGSGALAAEPEIVVMMQPDEEDTEIRWLRWLKCRPDGHYNSKKQSYAVTRTAKSQSNGVLR